MTTGINIGRLTIIGGLALTLALLIAGSGRAEIKVGIAGPLTGPNQGQGDQQEVGAQKAITHINESGGLLGQEIIVTSVDDACDPDQAVAAAEQLVAQGVIFVVGHLCSSTSLAVSKIYENAGIIMISAASTNPRVTDEGGPNIFRVIGRDDQQGAIAGDFLAESYSGKNIAVIHDGEAYGQGLAEHTKKQLNKHGIQEVYYSAFAAGQKDYSSLVDKLAAAKVDVLYAGGYQSDLALIIRQAKKRLPQLQLVSGDSLAGEEFSILAGAAGVGTLITFGPDFRGQPASAKIVAEFRDEDAYEPTGYTLYAYGAVQAWSQAVTQAGSLETKAVLAALQAGKFDTVLGKISFDAKGDVEGISAFVWYVFEEENYVPVK